MVADVFHWVYKPSGNQRGKTMSDPSTELNLAEIEAKLSHSNIAELPHTKVSHCLDLLLKKMGQCISCGLWLALMLLIVGNALNALLFQYDVCGVRGTAMALVRRWFQCSVCPTVLFTMVMFASMRWLSIGL